MSLMMSLLFNPLILLILAVLAVRTLRRTRDPSVPLTPSEQRWRTAALAFLVLCVAGFGLCGGAGAVFGLYGLLAPGASGDARGYAVVFLVPGALGLGVALVVAGLLRRYRRSAADRSGPTSV